VFGFAHDFCYLRVRVIGAIGDRVMSEMRCAKCGGPLIESSPIDGVLLLCQGCNAEEAYCSCKPLSDS